jgi:hypothetical protein
MPGIPEVLRSNGALPLKNREFPPSMCAARRARSLLDRGVMPASVQHERANIYRLEVRGLLSKAEMEECERSLEEQLAHERAVRLLVVLDRFEGWEPNAAWNDLRFYVSHGDAIERIAIVGEQRWHDLAMMFASADLRKAPVAFFHDQAAAEARAWLSQDG